MTFKKEIYLLGILCAALLIAINQLFIFAVLPLRTLEARIDYFREHGSNTSIIFLGHSYADNAINPERIPNSFNFAEGGYSFPHFYFQLRKILAQNTSINTVVITAQNLCFNSSKMERHIWHLGKFISIADLSKIFQKSFVETFILRFFPVIGNGIEFGNILAAPATPKLWNPSQNTLILSDTTIPHPEVYCRDEMTVQYLYKVLDFLQEKKITVIFLQYPVHPDFYKVGYLGDGTLDDLFEWYKGLSQQYPFVHALDMSTSITETQYFTDFNHLNASGAEIFSPLLSNKIQALLTTK